MEENINALDELNKGATMGMDALNFILDKVEDEKFKKILVNQYKEYEKISAKIKKIYDKYNKDKKPHETNAVNKAMTWSGIEMRTMNDQSNSKIAELLLQGTNMGIIEGRKIYNNKKVSKEVSDIVYEYIVMQENYIEKLKEYL